MAPSLNNFFKRETRAVEPGAAASRADSTYASGYHRKEGLACVVRIGRFGHSVKQARWLKTGSEECSRAPCDRNYRAISIRERELIIKQKTKAESIGRSIHRIRHEAIIGCSAVRRTCNGAGVGGRTSSSSGLP